jgi:hypothetical protein
MHLILHQADQPLPPPLYPQGVCAISPQTTNASGRKMAKERELKSMMRIKIGYSPT